MCVFYSSSAYPHPKVKMVEPRTDRPKYPRQNLSLICDGSHERQKPLVTTESARAGSFKLLN